MKRNNLPPIKSWHRLDEHVRRLSGTTEDIQTDVAALKTAPAQGGETPDLQAVTDEGSTTDKVINAVGYGANVSETKQFFVFSPDYAGGAEDLSILNYNTETSQMYSMSGSYQSIGMTVGKAVGGNMLEFSMSEPTGYISFNTTNSEGTQKGGIQIDTFGIRIGNTSQGYGTYLQKGLLTANRFNDLPDADGIIPALGTTAPASATAAGKVGEMRVTATYAYFCTAPNTWKRVAIAAW